jgi:L-aspartate oxidase
LALAGTDPFLVSEAVRGEGAYLRGANGNRFLAEGPLAHPLAELAPRDVVARAIQWQMAIDGADHVYLDLRHLDPDAMPVRFPTIARELAARGLKLATDPLPVAPAAHYFMGGVVASAEGTTSLPGLLAIGEAACTGVHGANRLASNSLLEGLVFGIAAAEAIGAGTQRTTVLCRSNRVGGSAATATTRSRSTGGDPPDEQTVTEWRKEVQRAMSRDVAVVRNRAGLDRARAALAKVAALLAQVDPAVTDAATARAVWEVRNMVAVGLAIVAAAGRRQESRGAHYRDDFPAVDPRLNGRHSIVAGGSWRWGTLAEALDCSPVAPVPVR